MLDYWNDRGQNDKEKVLYRFYKIIIGSKLVYPEFSNWNVTENYVKWVTLMLNGEISMISGFMNKFRRLGTEDVEGNFSFKLSRKENQS